MLAPDGAKVASNVVPVTYSKHGQKDAGRCGVGCAYVPHGVDPPVYRIGAR